MPIEFILPTSMTLAFVGYGLVARWYLMPRLARLPLAKAVEPLLLFHSFRFIGLAFLIPGVTATPLDSRFSAPAAYGDLAAALLALLAILAFRKDWRTAILILWIFNLEGTLDLINAVARGIRYTEDGDLGATYFIPAVIVPALLVSHWMIFTLLMKRRQRDS